METIQLKKINKIILKQSLNGSCYIELNKFENSGVYQIYSPGYYGVFLSKNKNAIFKKYIQLKNEVIKHNKIYDNYICKKIKK